MNYNDLFPNKKPLIGCIHLLSLPGSPEYSGEMKNILKQALIETEIFKSHKVDGLIIENFRDMPFYPDQVPVETVAAMTVVTNEIKKVFKGPIGVNVLRNDAKAAMAISSACKVQFIRVNVHIGTAVTDQGIIEGRAYETLRLRKSLNSDVLIFADVAVKHASPLGNRSIMDETKDLTERGLADAIIVTGSHTGGEASPKEINIIKQNTALPVIIGSGITPDNLNKYFSLVDGFIVGSFFKSDGIAKNLVEKSRVKRFMEQFRLQVN